MTTESAATALSGAPAAAPAAAPASVAGDAAALALAAAAAGAVRTPEIRAEWYDGITNPDTKTWVQAKGYKDPAAVAESAHYYEKLIGFDKAGRTVVVPDDKAGPEEIAAYRTKMGVPEKPDGYNIKPPEGQSDAFSKEASNWFHEAGIPANAAEKLAGKWNEYVATTTANAEKEFNIQSGIQFDALKSEWGQAYAQNLDIAKRAAAQFIPGTPDERATALNAMERAMGTGALLKLMNNIGKGLGEHKVHGDTGTGGNMMTPQQAQQRIVELKSNKEWSAAYLNGDKTKAQEMQQLHAMAYPEPAP